eukprot:augustus_masked-scaffold_78-processed-gene-0.13-mRNA-1 protein AED:1.00 eAED:1.00 QI:0/-1/0/0/-1/1/1/0/227
MESLEYLLDFDVDDVIDRVGFLNIENNNITDQESKVGLLKNLGFDLIEVPADGNCLFHCFALHLFPQSDSRHKEVRKYGMAYIKLNSNRFSPFVTEDFEAYVERKSRDQVWGDDLEVQALSEFYKLSVYVLSFVGRELQLVKRIVTGESSGKPLIMLYNKAHYNRLVPIPCLQTVYRVNSVIDTTSEIERIKKEYCDTQALTLRPTEFETNRIVQILRDLSKSNAQR